jgi:hypothetical protein
MMRVSTGAMMAMLLCAALALPRSAVAHLGPPYPILVDQPIPGYLVTVLANPDVGQAVCIVVLEPEASTPAPDVSGVDVWVQPVSKRRPKAVFPATHTWARGHLRFVAKPDLDAAEPWTVGVDIRLADGTNPSFVTQVEATPPGIGPWGLLFFLFPFLLFGGLWGLALVRRSRRAALSAGAVTAPSEAAAADSEAGTGSFHEDSRVEP